MVRSCLLSLQSKPLRPAEQASQTCWASLSGLLGKPPMLVEQVSWNVMGKSGPSSYRGPTWKDGLYLHWARGYGLIGLANGPIGPIRPYLTFYPLQDGDPSTGMIQVMCKSWWWTSSFANSTRGMRCPIPGLARIAMWGFCSIWTMYKSTMFWRDGFWKRIQWFLWLRLERLDGLYSVRTYG